MRFLERLFFRRPRILNQLHRFGLVNATSQTNEGELSTLALYAHGCRQAVEIGTYQGVSAIRIAETLAPNGVLLCIDPWPKMNLAHNPNRLIFERNLRRSTVRNRIRVVNALSSEVVDQIPHDLDFVFIDGDHSWKGIETDWNLVAPRIARRGVVCLHDSVTPESEPWRLLDSTRFYDEVISTDERFEVVDIVHSMAVLRKR
jgi:predicted O-methyltransferase YrrM